MNSFDNNRKFERLLFYSGGEPQEIPSTGRNRKVRISFLFAWYDIWVGLFWDKKKKWLYILPVPCFGIIIKFNL